MLLACDRLRRLSEPCRVGDAAAAGVLPAIGSPGELLAILHAGQGYEGCLGEACICPCAQPLSLFALAVKALGPTS